MINERRIEKARQDDKKVIAVNATLDKILLLRRKASFFPTHSVKANVAVI